MISTLDLSIVTERLVTLLEDAVTHSQLWAPIGPVTKFNIEVSGSMPELVRAKEGGCQLTVYLFHLSTEPFTRNIPPQGNTAQPNLRHSLGLNLYYLVSAFSKDRTQEEQQALSIAIKALHERGTYVDATDGFTFTITLESEKPDEANRRWQSFSTPFRLSAVYRVSVVFLTPKETALAPPPPPKRIGLGVGSGSLPFSKSGSLVATASGVDFAPIPPLPGDAVTYDYSPAIVSPGGSFMILGDQLLLSTAGRFYLMDSTGAEQEITAWKAPAAQNTGSRVVLSLPATIGALPGGSPQPGVYLVRVGSSTAAGDAVNYRSNAVPLTIAARIDPIVEPWTPLGGVFSFSGVGFVTGATEVLIDTVSLTPIAPGTLPGIGEFTMNATGTSISFQPPSSMTPGIYFVRLRVKGVEGSPVGKISLP
ncbi:MAG: DUF4255 domain-containing protein [Planctomycetota bacterium]